MAGNGRDLIVADVAMYNSGPPASFKAFIGNVVRVGRTFGFDRTRRGEPFWRARASGSCC